MTLATRLIRLVSGVRGLLGHLGTLGWLKGALVGKSRGTARHSTGTGHLTQTDSTGSRSRGSELRTGLGEDAEDGVGGVLDDLGTGLLDAAFVLRDVFGVVVVTVTSVFLLSSQQVLWVTGLTSGTGEMRAALCSALSFCCWANSCVGMLGMAPSGEVGMLGE